MNRFSAYGRLVADPDGRVFENSKGEDRTVCTFKIAVRDGKNQDGSDKAQFIPCQAWNGTADFILQYLKKGDPIAVTGKLIANDWIDQDNKKHYGWIINVDETESISKPAEQPQEATQSTNNKGKTNSRPYNKSGRK